MNKYTIKDYFRMAKVRGWRLPVQYFFQNHLFDIINNTDTHFRLEKKDYSGSLKDFDKGVLYMSCLTNEVKNALKKIERHLGNKFRNFQFLDLGSGKGKSLIIYSKLYGDKAKYKSIGIEYYKPLVDVAKANIQITRKSEQIQIINDDARCFKNYIDTNDLIVFLYNPFDKSILIDVLDKLQKLNVFIIYNDPAYDSLVRKAGFNMIDTKKGPYANRCINIYHRKH